MFIFNIGGDASQAVYVVKSDLFEYKRNGLRQVNSAFFDELPSKFGCVAIRPIVIVDDWDAAALPAPPRPYLMHCCAATSQLYKSLMTLAILANSE
jgi:hypothetical protein